MLIADNHDIICYHVNISCQSSTLTVHVEKGVIRSVDVLTLCEPVSPFLNEGHTRIVLLLNVGGNELQLACLLILSHT